MTAEPRNKPSVNLIGQKFQHLTITEIVHAHTPIRGWYMIVQCDCGRMGKSKLSKLQTGKRKTCGLNGCPHFHLMKKTNGRDGNFTGHEDIYGSRWKGWECGAIARNIEFTVSVEYAWGIYLDQNRKCALSGVDISFGNSWNKNITASLDRLDSSKGYVEGNIQWVHKHVNMMKRSLCDEEFVRWCTIIVDHRKTINQGSVSRTDICER
jgi:hypothetical protein